MLLIEITTRLRTDEKYGYVENVTQIHEFIRAVQHVKGSTASVILYIENQFVDVKRFWAREGSVLLGLEKII